MLLYFLKNDISLPEETKRSAEEKDMDNIRLMNAAGWIKEDGKSFRDLLRSAVSEITFGSITVPEMPGSTGQNFVVLDDGTSVNSLMLKNRGILKYKTELEPLVTTAHAAGKLFRRPKGRLVPTVSRRAS